MDSSDPRPFSQRPASEGMPDFLTDPEAAEQQRRAQAAADMQADEGARAHGWDPEAVRNPQAAGERAMAQAKIEAGVEPMERLLHQLAGTGSPDEVAGTPEQQMLAMLRSICAVTYENNLLLHRLIGRDAPRE
jgi:hypothetical protein